MTTIPTLLHGVPLHAWIGRQVKLNSRDAPGDARKPGVVKSFNEKAGTATVQPGGHRGTVVVPIAAILPWWSRNDDLRRKYGVAEPTPLQDLMSLRTRPAPPLLWLSPPAEPEVASTQPESKPVLAAVPVAISPPTPPVIMSQPLPNSVQNTPQMIRRIIVDPNASATWMDDYKALQDAMVAVKESELEIQHAQRRLDLAQETVATFVQALDGSGIIIEWAREESFTPTGVRSELDASRVTGFRIRLSKQLNPGRSYSKEQIRAILQEDPSATFDKIFQAVFRDHSHFKRQGSGTAGSLSYIYQP